MKALKEHILENILDIGAISNNINNSTKYAETILKIRKEFMEFYDICIKNIHNKKLNRSITGGVLWGGKPSRSMEISPLDNRSQKKICTEIGKLKDRLDKFVTINYKCRDFSDHSTSYLMEFPDFMDDRRKEAMFIFVTIEWDMKRVDIEAPNILFEK